MTIPTRPSAGASVATAWGQDVHDRVFAPKGCQVAGGTVTMANDTTFRPIPIDTATADPGGWADNAGNRLVVPTGAEGLYLIAFSIDSVTGVATSRNRVIAYRNGVSIAASTDDCLAGTHIQLSTTTVTPLVAGDIIDLQAQQLPAGGAMAVLSLTRLSVVRIGNDWGA